MKHFAKFGCGLLAVMMAACSSEEPIPVDGNGSGEGTNDVYATLTLKLPTVTGSRANDGYEVGKEYENKVSKVFVVLATKDGNSYKYLTKAESGTKLSADDSGDMVKYVLNFSSKEMDPNPLVGGSAIPGKKNVYVFVYCNPSFDLETKLGGLNAGDNFVDWEGLITDKDNAEIWKDNQFLMTNWVIADVDNNTAGAKNGWVNLPSRAELVDNHGKPESAFNLGTIEVKRAVARFDFMTTQIEGMEKPNVYPINDIDGKTPIGSVELTHMAMFNISKKFYYLPRTSTSWNWDLSNTTICSGLEEEFGYTEEGAVNNYVVSSNKSLKQQSPFTSTLADYFFSPVANSNYNWISLDKWNDRVADTDEGWNGPESHDYHIWRYATENTIPALPQGSVVQSQRAGITTGVVFRGEFTPKDAKVWNGNIVYVYKDLVYGDYEALMKYVDENPSSPIAAAVKKDGSSFFTYDSTKKEFVPKADPNGNLTSEEKGNGFKVYKPTADGKYEMYYFYYNRHNSNNNASVMGVNEFGVVRNNVYKLRVTKCGTLGNPEPPKPEDPDEEENAYFTVSCIVMPWTVRVNDIEF